MGRKCIGLLTDTISEKLLRDTFIFQPKDLTFLLMKKWRYITLKQIKDAH